MLLKLKAGARAHKEVKQDEQVRINRCSECAAAIEKVKGYITRFGGTVTNVDEWGKKRLAYEIQKSHEAYYYFIQFESDSVCPNEVEAHVRIMEPVIRYLCVKVEA